MGANSTRFYSSSKKIENVNIYLPQTLRSYQKLKCYTSNTPVLTYQKKLLHSNKPRLIEESSRKILEKSGDLVMSNKSLDRLMSYFQFLAKDYEREIRKRRLQDVMSILERPDPIVIPGEHRHAPFKEIAKKIIQTYFITNALVFLASKVQNFVRSILKL